MSNSYQFCHTNVRQIRRNFMMEAIAQGKQALDYLATTCPSLHTQIISTFQGQPARAAFWLVSDRDTCTRATPLQQLARGEDEKVSQRLTHYIPLKDRHDFV